MPCLAVGRQQDAKGEFIGTGVRRGIGRPVPQMMSDLVVGFLQGRGFARGYESLQILGQVDGTPIGAGVVLALVVTMR